MKTSLASFHITSYIWGKIWTWAINKKKRSKHQCKTYRDRPPNKKGMDGWMQCVCKRGRSEEIKGNRESDKWKEASSGIVGWEQEWQQERERKKENDYTIKATNTNVQRENLVKFWFICSDQCVKKTGWMNITMHQNLHISFLYISQKCLMSGLSTFKRNVKTVTRHFYASQTVFFCPSGHFFTTINCKIDHTSRR